MPSVLVRAVAAASYALGRAKPAAQITPNVFASTVYLCDEIAIAAEQIREMSVVLRVARATSNLDGMRVASSDIAIKAVQLRRMNRSLAEVLRWHADRQKSRGPLLGEGSHAD
jgi:hypothetical protein